ncbi:MAG: ATP-binding protein [Actinomycetota bacterium]
MRSLRRRLGVTIALGAFVLTSIAGLAVVYERWREALSALPSAIELEAFRLAESTGLRLGDLPGDEPFAVMIGFEAQELATVGDVSPDLYEILIDEIWTFTTDQDFAVFTEFDSGNGYFVMASGVACTNQARCDTVVVGATEAGFTDFVVARLGWVFGLAAATGLLTLLVVRWLIGRSLKPVEEMRRQLTAITATDLDARISPPPTGDEIEELGHTLDETIGRLSSAVAANERFVADAAHELRSPITGVRAAIEVEASSRESALLDGSLDELDRAARLVDDLLVLARRQADAAPRTEVDLDDVVRSALASFGVRHPDIEVERSIAPVRVLGDADALARVVTNLLDNAARYGGGSVLVHLAAEDDMARLAVQDDGPGVPPAERERVFERFARLDESRARDTGGSGLGLAIVRELVEAHGGMVGIGEAPTGGAVVAMRLPRI